MQGYWNSLLAGGLPAAWLVKLRQVGEGPSVLPQGLGPRDWSVQLGSLVITILKIVFSSMAFCLDLLLRGRVSLSLFLSCESVIINPMAKWHSCPLYSVEPRIMNFHMVYGDSMNQKHPHGFRHQHVPHTSAWSQLAVETMDMNMASSTAQFTDTITILSSSTGQGHQHGFRGQHGSQVFQ